MASDTQYHCATETGRQLSVFFKYISCFSYHYYYELTVNRLTGVLYRLTAVLFRLTAVLFRLAAVLFRLAAVLFRLTAVLFRLTGVPFRLTAVPELQKCFDCWSFSLFKTLTG